jgi:hypothetical protein
MLDPAKKTDCREADADVNAFEVVEGEAKGYPGAEENESGAEQDDSDDQQSLITYRARRADADILQRIPACRRVL